jgi:hypothetical protein
MIINAMDNKKKAEDTLQKIIDWWLNDAARRTCASFWYSTRWNQFYLKILNHRFRLKKHSLCYTFLRWISMKDWQKTRKTSTVMMDCIP